MTEPDAQLLAPLIDIAAQAAADIMSVYATDFSIEIKSDRSPVTAADMAAHNRITEGLARLTPDIPVLSEESSQIPYETRKKWSRYWLVDPLDGTKEFIHRNGEFTVNIALIIEGKPEAGIVFVPASGVCYYGYSGIGAYRRSKDDNEIQTLHVAPLAENTIRVVASRSHRSELVEAYLARLGRHELVSRGSSLKFCLLAEGQADVYPRLGPTSEWDTAAGHAILCAAGGHVTDLQGTPLRYNRKESLLNPFFLAYADSVHDWLQYLPEQALHPSG